MIAIVISLHVQLLTLSTAEIEKWDTELQKQKKGQKGEKKKIRIQYFQKISQKTLNSAPCSSVGGGGNTGDVLLPLQKILHISMEERSSAL